ncbi:MAG: hypothetical protein ABSD38_32895 [Syntrophorhabdales bacterium]|jgi:hypothetical protein
MTADTTFKEFVEEQGLSFSRVEFDSEKYGSLIERFNKLKLRLRAEMEARLHERAALLLVEGGHSRKAASPAPV